MALADPQAITISGSAKSLKRTGIGTNSGSFSTADGEVVLKITRQDGRRRRQTARMEHSKIIPDVYQNDRNVPVGLSIYTVMDTPAVGYTVAEAKAAVDGYIAWLSASSGAIITQLLGGEI